MVNDYQIYEESGKVCIFVPYDSRKTGVSTVHKCWIDLIHFEKFSKMNEDKRLYYLPAGEGYCYFQWDEIDKNGEKKRIALPLHRFLMEPEDDYVVDHKDRDGLNNTIENLRVCTYSENLANRRKFRSKKQQSQYKGVFIQGDYWIAKFAGEILGYFLREEDAALAFDEAAYKKYGEFAYLNLDLNPLHIHNEAMSLHIEQYLT